MRVVQVTRTGAYPPSSGAEQRIHGLMSGRRENDEVWRFAQCPLGTVEQPGETVTIDAGYAEYRAINRINSVFGFLTGLIDAPQLVTSPVMRLTDTNVLKRQCQRADVIQVEEPWQFDYVNEVAPPSTPIVFSSHNFEPELYAHLATDWRKVLLSRIRSVEHRAAEEADLVVVTTDHDRDRYRDEYCIEGPIHVAPNATMVPAASQLKLDTVPEISRSLEDDACMALFVGSDHGPNVRAVEYLLEECQSGRIDRPVHVVVVGSVCDAFEGQSLPENVHLEGFVEDLEAYYLRAEIALNPITDGGGSNVKLPEYMSYGLPIVTTPFGARGIPVADGTHVRVSDLDGFPEVIEQLCADPARRRAIGDQARALVETELNWHSVSRGLFERFESLLEEDKR